MRAVALAVLLVAAAAPVSAAAVPVSADGVASAAPSDVAPSAGAFDAQQEAPVSGLTFFPVSQPSPPPLKAGFSVEREATVGFAAYVDGSFVGGSRFVSLPAGSVVDGFEVSVTANLTGVHEVTVYAVRDSNGNGVVDAADEPYVEDGEPVHVNGTFTFDGGPQTTRRTTSASPTTTDNGGGDATTDRARSTTPGTPSSGDVPGFGVAAAAVGVVAAGLLALRR